MTSGSLYGGVETSILSLATHAHLCPEISFSFATCFEGRLSDELTQAGKTVHVLGRVKISRPWLIWRVRRRLRALLLHEKFDLVICHGTWIYLIFAPVIKFNLRVILWAHGVPSRHWIDLWARQYRPALIIANSYFTQSVVTKYFSRTPVDVVYCPFALPKVDHAEEVRTRVRTIFGVDRNSVVILMASRLEKGKGHAVLLQTLSRLATLNHWVCWITCWVQRKEDVQYLAGLRHLASTLQIGNRIRFIEENSNIQHLMMSSDIFCQPNTEPESFGLSFVEALYSGLPVVTSAIGGALEIVTNECGVLVPPNNVEALEMALRKLIQAGGQRVELGRSGPGRANELCNPKKNLDKLYELLSAVRKH